MAEKDAATDRNELENAVPTAENFAEWLTLTREEDYTAEDVFDDLKNTDATGNPIVRFNGNREDSVTFEIDPGSLYKGPYSPDRFEAEKFGLVSGIQDALDRLAEVADLRRVGNYRHGVFYVDEDEGRVSGVKLTFTDKWVPADVDLDDLKQELVDIVNDDEDDEGDDEPESRTDGGELEGDVFPEVEERVSVGDRIRVEYPTDHGTDTVAGEVTEKRTRFGAGNQSIRFGNENGVYAVRDFDPSYYSHEVDKPRSLHVVKDLNPGGSVHYDGLNEQGEPAEVEVVEDEPEVRTDGGQRVPDVILFSNEGGKDHLGVASGVGSLCGYVPDGWVGRDAPNDPDELTKRYPNVCASCLKSLNARYPDEDDEDEPEVRTDGGLTDAEESLRQSTEQDEEQPLDADDLSEGDVVELELSDGRITRYRVQGEWDDEDVTDLESYDRPSEEAEGKFPGLQAERVWTDTVNLDDRLPRYRATLVLDADSYTGGLVDNFPDDSREGYSVHSVRQARVVEVPDRWEVEGELSSPHASHVRRVVREAFEDDPLVSTIEAENVTLKDAEHSGAGCLGNDLGVTVHVAASMDLHVREAFEEFLFENLNEGVSFECERTGMWSFYRDSDSGTVPLR